MLLLLWDLPMGKGKSKPEYSLYLRTPTCRSFWWVWSPESSLWSWSFFGPVAGAVAEPFFFSALAKLVKHPSSPSSFTRRPWRHTLLRLPTKVSFLCVLMKSKSGSKMRLLPNKLADTGGLVLKAFQQNFPIFSRSLQPTWQRHCDPGGRSWPRKASH